MPYTIDLASVTLEDLPQVGGKNASLGELIAELTALGVRVPGGFAVTADAYRAFIQAADLEATIASKLRDAYSHHDRLAVAGHEIRQAILAHELPEDVAEAIRQAYREMADSGDPTVAVRSSATAEDLPGASFAGQQESYLHIRGEDQLLHHVRLCFASLYTNRAISYRRDQGFKDVEIALSVAVQRMVLADHGSSGVLFTIDTESGHSGVLVITAAYGLGENVVQGRVNPDEFLVHKELCQRGHRAILRRKIGSKELALRYVPARGGLVNQPVPEDQQRRLALSDDDVLTLTRWGIAIENHYSDHHGKKTAMDIEWAKDGETGDLYIVQARPETVHGKHDSAALKTYHLDTDVEPLCQGLAIGRAIGAGTARVIDSPKDIARFRDGEVLITDTTDPDWEPIMKRASAIVTERGGRTSHAAIVAREIGIPAVVAAQDARAVIGGGSEITVSCAAGSTGAIYPGILPFDTQTIDTSHLTETRTKVMMNLAQPDLALEMAALPAHGVGLARMEFVFASWVGIHPLALTRTGQLDFETRRQVEDAVAGYDSPEEFFVARLSEGIATLAGAFWPRPVIVRLSDFKSNEYAQLLGGQAFEPHEENPMIGWRGASRYAHPDFRDGFELEAQALARVRKDIGLHNMKLMVPFCRTPEEGQAVLDTLAACGLRRGEDGLEIYAMAEIPSNVFLAKEFAAIFDGFSIGSNDLTQLILGVDRDSSKLAGLFDERNPAIKRACRMLIEDAHAAGIPVGICGQAPSDHPDFAEFLVSLGIDSISVTPDTVLATRELVARIENAS